MSASSRSGSGRTRASSSLSRVRISAGCRERLAVRQRAARIDRRTCRPCVRHLPMRVVVLEAETEHVHAAVAGSANRVAAMLLQLLPQRSRVADGLFVERRNVRRRRREAARRECSAARTCRESPARCASDSSKPSGRWRGSECRRAGRWSVRRGGTRVRSRLRCRSASPAARSGTCTCASRNSRQRAVLAQHRFEEHPRLGLHRIAQLRSPFGELLRIRLDAVEVARLQPLAGEIVGQCRRARYRPASASPARPDVRTRSFPALGEAAAARRPASSSTGSSSAARRVRGRRSGAPSDRSDRDRARCGTGSAAKPASPESRVGCPARQLCLRPSPSATNRSSDATSVLRHRTAISAARQRRRRSCRRTGRPPSSDRRSESSCGSAFSTFAGNGPTKMIEFRNLFFLLL